MSTTENCDVCGKRYGASWGDVSGLCSDCSVGNTPEKIRERNKELEKRVQELEERIQEREEELANHNPQRVWVDI